MSQADTPSTPSRRSFLQMAGPGLLTAAVVTNVAASAEERIETHKAALIEAWTELYGEPAVIQHDETATMNKHFFIASKG